MENVHYCEEVLSKLFCMCVRVCVCMGFVRVSECACMHVCAGIPPSGACGVGVCVFVRLCVCVCLLCLCVYVHVSMYVCVDTSLCGVCPSLFDPSLILT